MIALSWCTIYLACAAFIAERTTGSQPFIRIGVGNICSFTINYTNNATELHYEQSDRSHGKTNSKLADQYDHMY